MSAGRVHIGCSGWQYADWREVLYPKGLPQRRWLEQYSGAFDTVEVNATFYRLAKPESVAGWVEQTPPGFVLTLKGSRFLTHMKRLRDTDQGLDRFFASVAPALASPKCGPILWQLPPDFQRDPERLDTFLTAARARHGGRHAVELRHRSWFEPETYGVLHAHGAALVLAHDGRRDEQLPYEQTTEWAFVRLHYGARGRRGNYADSELHEWAARVRDLSRNGDVFVYANNDWEGFAVKNARRLRRLVTDDP